MQCFPLTCRPQHGCQWWQPLTAQIPACKLKEVHPLHGGLQLSKITKKNNHIPYNMRCWKCCPPSSTHFWHLFRKCAFTCINSISGIKSISFTTKRGLGRFFWGFLPFSPTTNFIPPPHSSHPFRFISSALVMVQQAWSAGTHVNVHLLKRSQKKCGWRSTTFPISHVLRCVIIFLCNFIQL